MTEQNLNPMGREYTRAEWAASRHVGVSENNQSSNKPGGPLIYATGPYYPEHARMMADAWGILADALEREWKRELPSVSE